MQKITKNNCIEVLKQEFPKSISYWVKFGSDLDTEDGIIFALIPFEQYTIDVIKANDKSEMKRIFDFVEYLVSEADNAVQTAMTTGYLEYLMNEPEEIQFKTIVKYLGNNSIEYCKAWDKFTGVKTEGLWNNVDE